MSTKSRTLRFRAIMGPGGLERDRSIEIAPDGTILAIRAVRAAGAAYDGGLAVPGMPNAHSHIFQCALAGFGEAARGDDSFWSWRRAMYRLAGSITPEQLFDVARHGYARMLRAGFTHVVEFHYLHHDPDGARGPRTTRAVLAAAEEVGLPMSLLPVYYRTAGFDGAAPHAGQQRFAHGSVDEFMAAVEALGPAVAGVAPHSLRAVPADDLVELVAGVDATLGPAAPLHIHISEQELEVEECLAARGRTPVDLLADTVELGPRWSLVHATHATEAERTRLRSAGARVVLCPITEAHLGDGIFPAREHFLAGGAAAAGSDANVRISAIEEARQLEYGQRLRDRRRARLATEAGAGPVVWSWLAEGGGEAAVTRPGPTDGTGARLRLGRIEPGYRADFVVLGREGPNTLGHDWETLMDAWLVGGDRRDIEAVYVGGERRVERGSMAGEAEIRSAFGKAMGEIRRAI
ncbi:formimidoylglutamate deiminase [Candidatus Palauibacter soopunensis]|uniref:formimidoylglutamate deiminase n=1 Tax=Candidatus Palauibacter soopunensis TaxID=3056739 RepID=UPI00238B01CC|nr:formimidoylglutamate deiminase [Candidatus Palauibacter soopunensis]MDE2879567.1 formimidoylglutamate deiminase [Candidatus Palauibacter soopunensis]